MKINNDQLKINSSNQIFLKNYFIKRNYKSIGYWGIIFISALFGNSAAAQYEVNGKIVDTRGEGISFANIVLRQAVDSALITGTISDTNGVFKINTSKIGLLDIKVSIIGYFDFISKPFHINGSGPIQNLGTIPLNENSTRLKDIVIRSNTPLVEQKMDRMVLNIENRVSTAGATALEILERSPGVLVDRSSSSIGLLGKQGINVMINGKMNYMPENALFAFLQGMDASNISKIELITNPPASFDAQGNAGYINIILKTNPNDGLLGNYSLTGGYGKGVLGLGALNMNYRRNKINLYGNYNYSHNEQLQYTVVKRIIRDFKTDMTFDRHPTVDNQNYRIGLDYQVAKQTTLGFLYSGFRNSFDLQALYTSKNKKYNLEDTTITTDLNGQNIWKHSQYNLNLTHVLKNKGVLTLDFNILKYKNTNPTDYALAFSFDQNKIRNESLFTDKTTPFGVGVLKVDYTKDLNKNTKWGIGGKYFSGDFENDVRVTKNNYLLSEFTSNSILDENIIAFYTEIEQQISKKLKSKIGLRYEQSNTSLSMSGNENLVDRKLSRLFPSAFLQYNINEDQQINFQYNKRVNRPSFSNMAPFITFLDPNSQFSGNSNLQPAFSHNFQLGYSIKRISFILQYSDEDSTIVTFQNRFDTQNNRVYITPANLQSQQIMALSIGSPIKFTNWWDGNVFGTYQYQKSNTVENLGFFSISQHNLRINASQTIRLSKKIRMEFNGIYLSPSLAGNVRYESFKVLNWAIQKRFENGGVITFGIDDVFNSPASGGETNIPDQQLYMYRKPDFSNTTFKLVFSKSFGNTKMQANRNRNSGIEDKARVN